MFHFNVCRLNSFKSHYTQCMGYQNSHTQCMGCQEWSYSAWDAQSDHTEHRMPRVIIKLFFLFCQQLLLVFLRWCCPLNSLLMFSFSSPSRKFYFHLSLDILNVIRYVPIVLLLTRVKWDFCMCMLFLEYLAVSPEVLRGNVLQSEWNLLIGKHKFMHADILMFINKYTSSLCCLETNTHILR